MAEQIHFNGYSISHIDKSLQHSLMTTPTPKQYFILQILTHYYSHVMFFFFFSAVKCTRWREISVRQGLHLENKFLKLHKRISKLLGPRSPSMNSRAASIMCSTLKLHYPNSLLILHKSGQAMCQPVTDCAL